MEAEDTIFGGEAGAKRRADLRLRVIEHNVLVIAKYYSRITLARLAQLLDLSPADVRRCFSALPYLALCGALCCPILSMAPYLFPSSLSDGLHPQASSQ